MARKFFDILKDVADLIQAAKRNTENDLNLGLVEARNENEKHEKIVKLSFLNNNSILLRS